MKRMRAAATIAIRINAVFVVSICCSLGSSLGSSSAWAMIDCMAAPGEAKVGARYFWREIDGRKCWFLKTGDIPPKSQLRWPTKDRTDARSTSAVSPAAERRGPVAVPPPPVELPSVEPPSVEPSAIETPPADSADRSRSRTPSQLRFRTARVKPLAAPALNLGHGLDLMSGASLTAKTPPSLAPADPFHARFTGRGD
jgi:hypothetical protein